MLAEFRDTEQKFNLTEKEMSMIVISVEIETISLLNAARTKLIIGFRKILLDKVLIAKCELIH